MKILLVHNFYRSSSPSGEDAVFVGEAGLLREHGVTVVAYERNNDEIRGAFGAAFSCLWSRKSYSELKSLIRAEKPDIAHFHNIWYLISPSAYYACSDMGLPVVQTLHNYRMFCTNGLLLRDGGICEDCVGGYPLRGALRGCFRGSRLFSSAVALTETSHAIAGTWRKKIDAFIALTPFSKKMFVRCGLPEDRVYVKPNFFRAAAASGKPEEDFGLYIGRISGEKGVDVLIEAMRKCSETMPDFSLKIVGDGPLLESSRAKAKGIRQIEFTGRKNREECAELLARAMFVVIPSICYENFPMAAGEAFAAGRPVIASRLGALADIVEDSENGLLFNAGDPDDLAEKIRALAENPAERLRMGSNAMAAYEKNYSPEGNFRRLMEIYEKVLTDRK